MSEKCPRCGARRVSRLAIVATTMAVVAGTAIALAWPLTGNFFLGWFGGACALGATFATWSRWPEGMESE